MPKNALITDPTAADAPNGAVSNNIAVMESHTVRQLLEAGTPEQKRHAVYLLLHNLLGDRFDREAGVYDPDDFLYACVIGPGLRERLRLLEDPERAEYLQRAAKDEEILPMRDVIEDLRALDEHRALNQVQP